MEQRPLRRRRSVLYAPASNEKALARLATLSCDAFIVDLEDSVAPERKAEARERLAAFLAQSPRDGRERVVRINSLSGEWGAADIAAARACAPDAILLPKVETARDIEEAARAAPGIRLWAMVETARAVLDIAAIAALGRAPDTPLDCLVAGTNDLAKETGVRAGAERALLLPWLMQIVLGARAGGLDALDGPGNDFRDLEAFARECVQARDMGFDGKTLIHPAQIGPAERAFSPSAAEIAEALAVRAAFAEPQNASRGAISLHGRMVERLHLEMAERLLAKAGAATGESP